MIKYSQLISQYKKAIEKLDKCNSNLAPFYTKMGGELSDEDMKKVEVHLTKANSHKFNKNLLEVIAISGRLEVITDLMKESSPDEPQTLEALEVYQHMHGRAKHIAEAYSNLTIKNLKAKPAETPEK